MRIHHLLPFALLVAAPVPSRAQSDLAAKLSAIEKAIDAKREELHIPGIAIAIVKDDKVIYSKGMGLRNIEENLPVTTKTQFAIGSSSKAFTAMTVMMAVDEGKLTLTDSPKKYLSYFKINDPDIDTKITINDIMSHRSGLDRIDMVWYTGRLSSREVLQAIGTAKPTAKLGEKFQYQNAMFLAAGEIAAAVEKKPWRQLVADRIFKPLGMKTTNTDIADMHRQPDYALGYDWDAEKNATVYRPARRILNCAPAGAINSNVEEMANWVRLMLDGGVWNGKRLVSEKSYDALISPHMAMGPKVNYGYGWMLREWGSHKVVEHGGNIDGFNAQVALMPDAHVGFVLLTNVSASSLGAFTMNTVWENLVGGGPKPAGAQPSGAPTDPQKEIGTYQIAGAPISLEVTFSDGKLHMKPTGQPNLTLQPLGGRKYKLAEAPGDFFVTFRAAKDKPEVTEIFLQQPQGNVVATRHTSSYSADITVEELMKKVADAQGGEANLRKHGSVTVLLDMVAETQALTGTIAQRWRQGGGHVEEITLAAAGIGKKIATMRDCFDGTTGSDESSFLPSELKGKKELADAAAQAPFAPELEWRTLYKSVKIAGVEKVDGEECYIVQKQVENGSVFTDDISRKSFLLLKSTGREGSSETFKDYRDVQGVKIAFERVRTMGSITAAKLHVKSVRFDERIPDSAFRPHIQTAVTGNSTRSDWFMGYD